MFPEEVSEDGKSSSARVAIARLGDNNGVGVEPVQSDLPAYEAVQNRAQAPV